MLDVRARQAPGTRSALARRELVLLADLLGRRAGAVLILGTVVTGAGPHSGDTGDVQRFDINIRSAAQLHADVGDAADRPGDRDGCSPSGWRRHRAATPQALDGAGHHGRRPGRRSASPSTSSAIPTGLVAIHVAGATLLWILALVPAALARPAAMPGSGQPALRSAGRWRWRGTAASDR